MNTKPLYCPTWWNTEAYYIDSKTGLRICGTCDRPARLIDQPKGKEEEAERYALRLRTEKQKQE